MNPLIDRFFKDSDHPFARSSSEAMSAMRKWIFSLTFLLYLISRDKLIVNKLDVPGVDVKLPTSSDLQVFLLVVLLFLVIQYLLYAVSYNSNEFSLFLAKRRSELFFDNLASFIQADESMKRKLDELKEKGRIRQTLQKLEMQDQHFVTPDTRENERLRKSLEDRAEDALFHFIGAEFQLSRRKVMLGTVPLILIDSIKIYSCIILFLFVSVPIIL